MEFREYYSILENASRLTMEDYMANGNIRKQVRDAIGQMLRILFEVGRSLVDGDGDELMWNLMKKGYLQAPLVQEILDVITLYKSGSDEMIYVSLVRIMEDIEEAYLVLKDFTSRKIS